MDIRKKMDPKRYARLLVKVLPQPIESDGECNRITTVIESMMNTDLNPEQEALLKLLSQLVSEYEDRTIPSPAITPTEKLQHLLESSGMKQKDLGQLLGTSKGYTSNIVTGKRPISKEHAKILANHFKMSVESFL